VTHDNPAPSQPDENTPLPESYSTFWDAVPVDVGSPAESPAPAPTPPPASDDAYAAFMALSEDGPSTTLQVERY
jgi:hypothetical protein